MVMATVDQVDTTVTISENVFSRRSWHDKEKQKQESDQKQRDLERIVLQDITDSTEE